MKTFIIYVIYICLFGITNILYSQNATRNYDVLRYDLSVDWVDILNSQKGEIDKRQWNGTMQITLTPLVNNLATIELDAVKLQISRVILSVYRDGNLAFTETIPSYSTDDKLIIPLPLIPPTGFINIGDTMILQIDYTYNNPYNKGFSYRNSADAYPDDYKFDIDAPSAGTQSEPEDARYWFPCNDVPNDKALLSVKANVPYGMKAASNGTLDSSVVIYNTGNNIPYSEVFYWTSKHPMPPYLITIAAANYDLHIERMSINSTTTDSIDVYYYTFPGDWEGGNDYSAKRNLSTTQKTMQIYSDLFGDYPFEKYGYATVDYTYLDYRTLGMEHQTLTTTNRYWVKNFIAVPGFTSFAHELAHHWFGDMVTCKNWNDVWFNEGGATWLEAMYMERINGSIDTNAYYDFMLSCRESYLRYDSLYNIPIGKLEGTAALFNYSILTYAKASWIFHHLRVLLGDDVFPLFRKLLEQYKFDNISAEEFVNFFVDNIPNPPQNIDIKKFIEQFIIYGGHPKYIIDTEVYENDYWEYVTTVNLKQAQQKTDQTLDNYLMYLKIDFFDANDNLIESQYVRNDNQDQTYTFHLDKAPPVKVVLDTTRALLEIIENNITRIDDTLLQILSVYPNPVNGNYEITIAETLNISNLTLIDAMGNNISSNLDYICIDNKTNIKLPNLTAGTYFIVANGRQSYKIIVQ